MFGYVILHYQSIEITKKCVDKLLMFSKNNPIIIVDNCSPNGSGKQLEKMYSKCINITVIINEENQGFAKGNNLGYQYIKRKYSLNYVVVMNNDIMIEDNDFAVIIEQFMEKNEVDVCGPDMVTLKGNHQNPLQLKPYTSKYLQRRVRADKIKVLLLRTRLFWKLYENYKKTNKIPIRTKQPTVFDCILHGSCIIYGPEYIKREQNAFLPITYMYNEEAILYDYLVHKGYKTGYCSDVTILHMEGVSTSERSENKKKKVMFRFKNKRMMQVGRTMREVSELTMIYKLSIWLTELVDIEIRIY